MSDDSEAKAKAFLDEFAMHGLLGTGYVRTRNKSCYLLHLLMLPLFSFFFANAPLFHQPRSLLLRAPRLAACGFSQRTNRSVLSFGNERKKRIFCLSLSCWVKTNSTASRLFCNRRGNSTCQTLAYVCVSALLHESHAVCAW